MSSDDNVEILYNIAKIWINNNNFNPSTIIPFVTTLIRCTQKLVSEKAKGPYKKELVLTILKKVIENDITFENDSDKIQVLVIVENTIPIFIDTSVGIATGEIDLRKRAEQVGKIWKVCFPCCF